MASAARTGLLSLPVIGLVLGFGCSSPFEPEPTPTLFIVNPLCDGTGCKALQIRAFIWEYLQMIPQSPFGAEAVGEVAGPSACLSFPEGWEITVTERDSQGDPVHIDTITSSLGDEIFLTVLDRESAYWLLGMTETFIPNSSPGWNLALTENADPHAPPFSAQLTTAPRCTPDPAKAGTPLPLIQDQLGHSRIEQTMEYARFHPDYGDLKKYFRQVAENFGLSAGVQGAIWGTQGKGQSR